MKYLSIAALSIAASLVFGTQTHAATPPDSCFAFNAGTGTITDYYNNEANNPANPACTREVDIPSTIGGTPVLSLGNSAFIGNQLTDVTIPSSVTSIGNLTFSNNQLTAVTIPNTVTSIGTSAFQTNQLSSLVLSDSVTSIGYGTFYNNQLTTVTVPNSVTSIGDYAFYSNRLTAVTLPDNLTAIGALAFYYNGISSVSIPTSLTSIGHGAFAAQSQWAKDIDSGLNGAPYLYSSDPAEVQLAYDSIFYVKLHIQGSGNPGGLVNDVLFEDWWIADDANDDGVNNSLGGHLINPASVELEYVDDSNASVQTSQMFTGLYGEEYLNTYLVSEGPVMPMPANPSSPTPTEQAAIDEALSAYYRIGDSITIDPPAINGYITPEPQTFVLGAADNTFSYVYAQADSPDSGAPATPVSDEDELADTGISSIVYAVSALAMTSLGALILTRRV